MQEPAVSMLPSLMPLLTVGMPQRLLGRLRWLRRYRPDCLSQPIRISPKSQIRTVVDPRCGEPDGYMLLTVLNLPGCHSSKYIFEILWISLNLSSCISYWHYQFISNYYQSLTTLTTFQLLKQQLVTCGHPEISTSSTEPQRCPEVGGSLRSFRCLWSSWRVAWKICPRGRCRAPRANDLGLKKCSCG